MCLGWLSFSLIYEDMGVAIDINERYHNMSPSRFGAPKFHGKPAAPLPSMRFFSNLTNGKPKVILGNSRPEFKADI